jgi:hypothetical protein
MNVREWMYRGGRGGRLSTRSVTTLSTFASVCEDDVVVERTRLPGFEKPKPARLRIICPCRVLRTHHQTNRVPFLNPLPYLVLWTNNRHPFSNLVLVESPCERQSRAFLTWRIRVTFLGSKTVRATTRLRSAISNQL